MDYLAGIDIGSTTLKAVIYDLAGNAVAHAARPTERFHPYPEHPDWAVWKPEQIWGACATPFVRPPRNWTIRPISKASP